ncbi:hypothetical protein V1506DRAFT_525210 [Lipomyces tetrasporus]
MTARTKLFGPLGPRHVCRRGACHRLRSSSSTSEYFTVPTSSFANILMLVKSAFKNGARGESGMRNEQLPARPPKPPNELAISEQQTQDQSLMTLRSGETRQSREPTRSEQASEDWPDLHQSNSRINQSPVTSDMKKAAYLHQGKLGENSTTDYRERNPPYW